MDVLWFRIPRRDSDPGHSMGRFEAGRIFVLIDRGDYWHAPTSSRRADRRGSRAGLDAFRANLAASVPAFADRVGEIKDWDQVKLLPSRSIG